MKRQVRLCVFETNSSSTHSITLHKASITSLEIISELTCGAIGSNEINISNEFGNNSHIIISDIPTVSSSECDIEILRIASLEARISFAYLCMVKYITVNADSFIKEYTIKSTYFNGCDHEYKQYDYSFNNIHSYVMRHPIGKIGWDMLKEKAGDRKIVFSYAIQENTDMYMNTFFVDSEKSIYSNILDNEECLKESFDKIFNMDDVIVISNIPYCVQETCDYMPEIKYTTL